MYIVVELKLHPVWDIKRHFFECVHSLSPSSGIRAPPRKKLMTSEGEGAIKRCLKLYDENLLTPGHVLYCVVYEY